VDCSYQKSRAETSKNKREEEFMRITGLYFSESERMLKDIEACIPPAHKKAMPAIKAALDDSAGRGMNGENSCTSTMTIGGYQVTANVCCGGYAEITVLMVKEKKIL
jgi:hypothetical protein